MIKKDSLTARITPTLMPIGWMVLGSGFAFLRPESSFVVILIVNILIATLLGVFYARMFDMSVTAWDSFEVGMSLIILVVSAVCEYWMIAPGVFRAIGALILLVEYALVMLVIWDRMPGSVLLILGSAMVTVPLGTIGLFQVFYPNTIPW